MSAKIRVSYTYPFELEQVKNLLEPCTIKTKVPKEQKGVYKRAYFELKITPRDGGNR